LSGKLSEWKAAVIDLQEEPIADLRAHAAILNVFESQSIYDVRPVSGGFKLIERALEVPFRKTYDDCEDPLTWPRELCTAQSVLIAAFFQDRRVGGIVAVVPTPGMLSWPHVPDVAVLWDLRVTSEHRRQSVATSLLDAAQAWGRGRGCAELNVETQNTNLAACKFYMRNGFVLQDARHGAYPRFPEEVQLIWKKRIDG
jgi:streptothricin acetyltransferase